MRFGHNAPVAAMLGVYDPAWINNLLILGHWCCSGTGCRIGICFVAVMRVIFYYYCPLLQDVVRRFCQTFYSTGHRPRQPGRLDDGAGVAFQAALESGSGPSSMAHRLQRGWWPQLHGCVFFFTFLFRIFARTATPIIINTPIMAASFRLLFPLFNYGRVSAIGFHFNHF